MGQQAQFHEGPVGGGGGLSPRAWEQGVLMLPTILRGPGGERHLSSSGSASHLQIRPFFVVEREDHQRTALALYVLIEGEGLCLVQERLPFQAEILVLIDVGPPSANAAGLSKVYPTPPKTRGAMTSSLRKPKTENTRQCTAGSNNNKPRQTALAEQLHPS